MEGEGFRGHPSSVHNIRNFVKLLYRLNYNRDAGVTDVDAPRATEGSVPSRDPDAVLRFIERFAATLDDSGVPRMPARVFVALLATDSGRLTASELADLLRVSPAAISGAVRYLGHVGLTTREREPGSRRDHYRVDDHAWYEVTLRRERLLARWLDDARVGMEVLGPDTPAGARMAETAEFLEFLLEELPGLLERWRQRLARTGEAPAAGR
jgi:DNA-binding transcriptional regulator GbsR (MarR family)